MRNTEQIASAIADSVQSSLRAAIPRGYIKRATPRFMSIMYNTCYVCDVIVCEDRIRYGAIGDLGFDVDFPLNNPDCISDLVEHVIGMIHERFPLRSLSRRK